jgi:ribosome-associated protein
MTEIEVAHEPVELYKLLKFGGMASSGGEAKYFISEGNVSVNGKIETRKRRKIIAGDIVELGENKLQVKLQS